MFEILVVNKNRQKSLLWSENSVLREFSKNIIYNIFKDDRTYNLFYFKFDRTTIEMHSKFSDKINAIDFKSVNSLIK